jgi:hypothetical protein
VKKKMMENKLLATRTVLLALPLLVLLLMTPLTVAAKSSSPYSTGYKHGCSDASLPTSEQYINQPGKGAEFHTGMFMAGYNAGHDYCSNNTPNSNPSPIGPSSRPDTQSLKDKFCNFVHSGDGAAASALVTLLGYPTVAAAAQAICV